MIEAKWLYATIRGSRPLIRVGQSTPQRAIGRPAHVSAPATSAGTLLDARARITMSR